MDIDLAILTIKDSNAANYPFAYYSSDFKIGDEVIAVGYPSYTQNVVEFSVSEGEITNIKDVLSQSSGKNFRAIESDAYTHFGSSGGGLFDSQGNLIGINTWGSTGNSIAIDFSSISGEGFPYCDGDSYFYGGKCYNRCDRDEILGSDFRCYESCGSEFYCETNPPQVNDPRCQDSSWVLGSDGYCHQPCGSGYCLRNNYCFRNQCTYCNDPNTVLWRDGTCRLYG